MQSSIVDDLEWGPPHFLDEKPIPPWPVNVFPKNIENFISELSRSTETPIELSAMLSLAVLATASQKKFQVQIKEGYCEPTNLWTVGVLPPASRKSSVYKTLTEPLRKWEKEQKTITEPLIFTTDSQIKTFEARIKGLRLQAGKVTNDDDYLKIQGEIEGIESKIPELPRIPQIWASDVTNEQLGVIMAQNGEAMSLLSDEGGIFDIIGGLYNEGRSNIDLLLQAHSGGSVRVDRGSRPPVLMERALLTMGLTVQPEIIRKICSNKTYRGRGLLGRFLYVIPKSNIGFRKLDAAPLPHNCAEDFQKIIESILNFNTLVASSKGEIYTLTLEEPAYKKWLEYARCIESLMSEGIGHLSHITDWAGKLAGAVARIAGLLHIARYAVERPWEHKISLEDVSAAIKIAHALTGHALIVFDILNEDSATAVARTIQGWIKEEKLEVFTQRECERKFRRLKKEDLKKGLEILEEVEILRSWKKTPTQGRPSDMYGVNPLIWKDLRM